MSNLEVEDLLQNESFLNYYFQRNEADTWEWEDWVENHPQRQALVHEAFTMLDTLSLKWDENQIKRQYIYLQSDIEADLRYNTLFAAYLKKTSIGIAATLMLFFGISYFWTNSQNPYETLVENSPQPLQEQQNTHQKPMLINLPDGSSVLLQKDSRLSYPQQFDGKQRIVYLEGDAFFEVAKDSQKPFFVYANELVTKVLGTSFRIQAKRGETDIKVLVKTGKVSVFRLADAHKNLENKKLEGVIITPNQQISFDTKHDRFSKELVESPEILSEIKASNFEFENTPVSEVFNQMESMYGIKIVYNAEVWRHCPLSASLNDEPMYGKLDLICRAIEANYQTIDGQIVINGKGCEQ